MYWQKADVLCRPPPFYTMVLGSPMGRGLINYSNMFASGCALTPPLLMHDCVGVPMGLGAVNMYAGGCACPPPNNFWGVADVLGVSRTMVLPRGVGVGARICTSPYFACCSKLLQFNSR